MAYIRIYFYSFCLICYL